VVTIWNRLIRNNAKIATHEYMMNIVGVGSRTDFFRLFFLLMNLFFVLVNEGFFSYNAFLNLSFE